MKIANSFNLVSAREVTGSFTMVSNDLLYGKYESLSDSARLLYGIFRSRLSLSIQNNWLDEDGQVYFIFTLEEIAKIKKCSPAKANRLKKELIDAGLLISHQPNRTKAARLYLISPEPTQIKYANDGLSNMIIRDDGLSNMRDHGLSNMRDNIDRLDINRTTNKTDTSKTDTIKPAISSQNNNLISSQETQKTQTRSSEQQSLMDAAEVTSEELHDDLFNDLAYRRIELLAKQLNVSVKQIKDLILKAKNKAFKDGGYPGSTIDIKLYRNTVAKDLAKIINAFKNDHIENLQAYVYKTFYNEFSSVLEKLYAAHIVFETEKVQDLGETALKEYEFEINEQLQAAKALTL